MSESDTDLYMRLLAVADVETKVSKAPCRYLGLEVGFNQYEPDPQNWDAGDAQKTHANVFYEFQHVTSRGSPYMVCSNATHLLHNGRRLPMNPLRNTCPSCLTFSVEFQPEPEDVLRGLLSDLPESVSVDRLERLTRPKSLRQRR